MLIRRHPIDIIKLIPKRSKNAHKGSCGRVLLITGSNQYTGAAELMVEAALRSGIGMVYVIAIHQVANLIRQQSPEAIVTEVHEDDGVISKKAVPIILKLLDENSINAIGIGPGLGESDKMSHFYDSLITELFVRKIPTVVDADSLTPFFKRLQTQEDLQTEQFVLTPHPKEFAKMTDREFNGVIDKSDILKESKYIKQVIAYKTNKTVVTNDKEIWLSITGNEGLATAGSGDVLAGIITGFLGQGLTCFEATKLGVYIHGLTAEIAVEELGIHSLLARDLISWLPSSFREVLHGSH